MFENSRFTLMNQRITYAKSLLKKEYDSIPF